MNKQIKDYFRQQAQLGYSTIYNCNVAESSETSMLPQKSDQISNPNKNLQELYKHESGCSKCVLGSTRKNFVFGSGSPKAKLMFIGEAPGADEDAKGEVFIGKSGQLLTKMIENGMGIKRKDVYIANILKCRPPGNRDPKPSEREMCTPILMEQINIIKPEFICCLGRIAGRFILHLDENTTLKSMRGKFYNLLNAKICVTYHPSALLQHQEWKRNAWQDLQILMRAMGL